MSDETVIELSGVDVSPAEAADTVLVRGVDWRIGRGEFWAVAGAPESGTGTLLATAAGLNRPGGGTLRIFGRDLAAAMEAEQVDWRRRIGFVFENGGRLLTQLTVAQNIALPLAYHTALDEAAIGGRVAEWLARAELGELASAMPSRLSQRLQQRAGLARALAVPTDVLFVDNPPVGLSGQDAAWWREQLGALHAQGLTVVVGGNDCTAWRETATRFAVVENERFRVLGDRDAGRAGKEN